MARIDHQLPATIRMELVVEMLTAAEGNAKQAQAINAYVSWHEADKRYPEPDVYALVSRTAEDAITSDLAHIYAGKLPEGTYGSQYERKFVSLKEANARRAAARRKTGVQRLLGKHLAL